MNAMSGLLGNLLVFGRLLRRLGLEVHLGRLLDIVEAFQFINIGSRDDVYHTCRALLVRQREDRAIFDRAFDAFWKVHGRGLASADREPASAPQKDRPPRSPSRGEPRPSGTAATVSGE